LPEFPLDAKAWHPEFEHPLLPVDAVMIGNSFCLKKSLALVGLDPAKSDNVPADGFTRKSPDPHEALKKSVSRVSAIRFIIESYLATA
jgi:hypothetical protein